MSRRARSLLRDARGVSAIEFAICAPIFITLLLAGADTLRYYFISDEIDFVASTVAEMISEHATGTVSYQDIQFYHDSAMLAYPGLLTAAFRSGTPWTSTISISMTSVDFGGAQTGCGDNCVYVPKVVWSGGDNARSCLVPLLPARDDDPPSPLTLPAHIYGPGSTVVVDVVYPFRPIFQSQFLPTFFIKRSYYIAPRFAPLLRYQKTPGDNGIAAPCPAYS